MIVWNRLLDVNSKEDEDRNCPLFFFTKKRYVMVLGMDLNGPVGWPTDYSPGEIVAGLIIFVVMVGFTGYWSWKNSGDE